MKNITLRSVSGLLVISLAAICGIIMPKSVKAEGICTEIGLTSLDERVIIDEDEDCIYVMPHPTNQDYFVSSDMLSGSYLSSRRYSLSYTDDNMEEAECENVLGGYIRAEYMRDSEVVYYIPVKAYKSSEYTAAFGEGMYTPLTGGSTSGAKRGLGGRDSDKTAASLTPPAAGLTEWDSMQHSFTSIEIDGEAMDNSRTFSLEFNAYAEGDTILRLNCDYSGESNVFARWLGDGTVEVNNDGVMTAVGTLSRGAWHRIAVSYDSIRHRYSLFADGKPIDGNSPVWTGGARICYGIDAGSSTGFAAFSDLKYYYGYYYPELYYTPAQLTSESESVSVDNEEMAIYADTSAIGSIKALMSVLSSDGAYMGSEYDEIFAGATIVTETEDGIIANYSIKSPVFCESIEFSGTGATAVLKNKLQNEAPAVMIMIERDENNIITSVRTSARQMITADGTVFTIDNSPGTGSIKEAFFITGWEDRLGLFSEIYRN